MTEVTISIDGMHRGGCVRSVEQTLRKLPGVHLLSVATGSARLAFDEAGFTPQPRVNGWRKQMDRRTSAS